MLGRQSLNRFSAKQVLATTQEENQEKFFVPAITICPINSALQTGFTNGSQQDGFTGNLVINLVINEHL